MPIGGKPTSGASAYGLVNPATGSVFVEAPECAPGQLDEAMKAASDAFVTWRVDEELRGAPACGGRRTQLGPINNRPQFERVSGLVADALAHGAQATVGGKAFDGPGYFFAPTVLVDVAEGVRIVDEEQFGPALPVMTYRDVDDAVARANATTFGLSGSVWTADPERGAAVAERLECGTSLVNAHSEPGPDQPLVGAKWSGIGAENGHWGLEGMTQLQVRYSVRA